MAGKKQFDVDIALDAAMVRFWRAGYADTSLDDLSRATGLNRSSIYSSFGDKDSLYLRCLDRYAAGYGDRYEQALSSGASGEPLRAIQAFSRSPSNASPTPTCRTDVSSIRPRWRHQYSAPLSPRVRSKLWGFSVRGCGPP